MSLLALKMEGAICRGCKELSATTSQQPQRKQGTQSYNGKELNFANNRDKLGRGVSDENMVGQHLVDSILVRVL